MFADVLGHTPVLLPLVFLAGALVTVLACWRAPRRAHPLAVATAGLALLLACGGLGRVLSAGPLRYRLGGWDPSVGIELLLDPLSALLTLVIAAVGLLVLLHARGTVANELPGRETPFFAGSLLFLGGLTGMTVTADLFNLYVFLEIGALSSYALLGVGSRRAPLSAFRYLVMGTTAGALYLLGLALVYMQAGTLNMAALADLMPVLAERIPVRVGLVFMLAGLALKAGVFPLHGWLPDVYTDSSSSAAALIAPIGTKVAFYAILRVVVDILGPGLAGGAFPVADVLATLGAAAILWGSVMAMGAKELKRMLAYSSVAQIGYLALGVGLLSPLGLIGAVLHLVNHACMKGCLFLVSGNLRWSIGHSRVPNLDVTVRRRMPWSMAAFTIAALSMVGIPPTAGFFSKWYLALATIEQDRWLLLCVLLASTLLNAVYFWRVLERIYLTPQAPGASGRKARGEAPGLMLGPTLAFGGLILVLGVSNAYLVQHVLRAMFSGVGG